MTKYSNSAPVLIQDKPEGFDPATWLRRFRDVGGRWAIDADGRPGLGWVFLDDDLADATGREMFAEIRRDQDKLDAIYEYILASAAA